ASGQVVTLSNVADTTTIAPGHGAFTSFGTPSLSGSNVAFIAFYSGGSGIYTGNAGATGAAKVVDLGDAAPGHGAFTSFGSASCRGSDNDVAFEGGCGGGYGVSSGEVGTRGATRVVGKEDTATGDED